MKKSKTKVFKFENEQDWLDGRNGKITGTKLKDLIIKRGTEQKVGFYELIAERIAIPPADENMMDRGKRLEEGALERFEKETGKKVNKELVLICREDNENICYSPDGFIGKTETVEVKCLKSALHLKAMLTEKIPSEYEEQALQPFIVNEELKKLYFVFYDPRMPKDFFYITIHRKDLTEEIEKYLTLEREVLEKIKEIENKVTF